MSPRTDRGFASPAELNAWSRRAEASGIASLQEFSRAIRCYAA